MADFMYRFGGNDPDVPKFKTLYENSFRIVSGFDVFYNGNTITRIVDGEDSLALLGYVYKEGDDLDAYLRDFLHDFVPENIAEAKKNLLGQYTVVVCKGNTLYLFSDFLQVRSIYFDAKGKSVGSSFRALYTGDAGRTDEYKIFEFLAMRHCSYPAWLGDTTLDDRIKRVRACEYLKIDVRSGEIEVIDFPIGMDNVKSGSLKEIGRYTLAMLRNLIRHPSFRDRKVCSTITGGFDSRLVTALVHEYYPRCELRISAYKGERALDHTLAARVADALSLPLEIHETDMQRSEGIFYDITDGMAPRENAVITQLLQDVDDEILGFGGAFGTELYTSVAYGSIDDLVADYVARSRKYIQADDAFYERFESALRSEFDYIRKHYILKNPDERDCMRLFRLINTGYFSSPLVSSFNIYGNQYEIFGTFPVIEAGLRIPYEYMGDKWTFGRFYLVPKILLATIHPKISRIMTTHFCPMCPLTVSSFLPYVLGRFERKKYYKRQADLRRGKTVSLRLDTDRIRYDSTDWFEGFMRTYVSEKP